MTSSRSRSATWRATIASIASSGRSRSPSVRAIAGMTRSTSLDRRRERDEDAVREPVLHLAREPQREPGLAGAGRTGQRQHAHLVPGQQLGARAELPLAADQRVGVVGEVGPDIDRRRCGRPCAVRLELGILRQDLRLQGAQRGARREPELAAQVVARPLERAERLRLPAAPVQRAHQLRREALVKRVIRRQRVQLRDDRLVCAQPQMRLDAQLQGGQPERLQPACLGLHELLEGDVRQRRAPPQRQGGAQHRRRAVGIVAVERAAALAHPLLQHGGVELLGGHREQVAAVDGPQHGRARVRIGERLQRLAQPRDRHLQRLGRVGGDVLVPERVGDLVRGHRAVRVEQQQRQQGPLLRAAERDGRVVMDDLHRAQQPECDHRPDLRTPSREPNPRPPLPHVTGP